MRELTSISMRHCLRSALNICSSEKSLLHYVAKSTNRTDSKRSFRLFALIFWGAAGHRDERAGPRFSCEDVDTPSAAWPTRDLPGWNCRRRRLGFAGPDSEAGEHDSSGKNDDFPCFHCASPLALVTSPYHTDELERHSDLTETQKLHRRSECIPTCSSEKATENSVVKREREDFLRLVRFW